MSLPSAAPKTGGQVCRSRKLNCIVAGRCSIVAEKVRGFTQNVRKKGGKHTYTILHGPAPKARISHPWPQQTKRSTGQLGSHHFNGQLLQRPRVPLWNTTQPMSAAARSVQRVSVGPGNGQTCGFLNRPTLLLERWSDALHNRRRHQL